MPASTSESGRSEAALGAEESVCRIEGSTQVVRHRYRSGRLVYSRLEVPADGFTSESHFDYEGDRLVQVRETFGRTAITYRDDGRVDEVRKFLSGVEQSRATFRYDDAGRLVARESGEARCSLEYRDGRLASVWCGVPGLEEGDGRELATFTFDAQGRLRSRTDVSGVSTFSYDEAGRLVARRTQAPDMAVRTLRLVWTAGGVSERIEEDGTARSVERITYEGDFPSGFDCAGEPPTPPGVPDPVYVFNWWR